MRFIRPGYGSSKVPAYSQFVPLFCDYHVVLRWVILTRRLYRIPDTLSSEKGQFENIFAKDGKRMESFV